MKNVEITNRSILLSMPSMFTCNYSAASNAAAIRLNSCVDFCASLLIYHSVNSAAMLGFALPEGLPLAAVYAKLNISEELRQ